MHRAAGQNRVLKHTLIFLALGALLGSCATAPDLAGSDPRMYLKSGASVYLGVDVAGNQELLAELLTDLGTDVVGAVNRTRIIVGSAGQPDATGDPPAFSAAVLGSFPRGAVRYSLRRSDFFDRFVARPESGRFVYFRSIDGSYEIAIPRSGFLLISTSSVVALAESFLSTVPSTQSALPPTVVDSLRDLSEPDGRDIFVVFPQPRTVLEEQFGLSVDRFPVLGFSLAVYAGGPDELDLHGEFTFENESQAALFARVGRVFVLGLARSLGIDVATIRDTLEIRSVENRLEFEGIPLTADDLSRLASQLTLGSTAGGLL